MADPNVLAADQILKLANQNGLTDPELYHFAKDFLIQNSTIEAFYVWLIRLPQPPRMFDDPETIAYNNIFLFMTNNDLLTDFYNYLVTVSPPIPPLP